MSQNTSRFANFVLMLGLLGALPATANTNVMATEATLCRSQMTVLEGRMTDDEMARYAAQCDCLQKLADEGSTARETCAEGKRE